VKTSPKTLPNPFFANIYVIMHTYINLTLKKVAQKCRLLYIIFKKQPKVNNRPLGENSPNLATLPIPQFFPFFLSPSLSFVFLNSPVREFV
jgi:hypothetical protein